MMNTLFRIATGTLVVGMILADVSEASSEEAKGKASSPQGSILDELVCLRVVVEAPMIAAPQLELICPTNTYQGELNSRAGGVSLRVAISGTIERSDQEWFLISYDIEVRYEDGTRRIRFSAAGSGLLQNGKPMKIVTAAGKSVTMTATTTEGNPGFECRVPQEEAPA